MIGFTKWEVFVGVFLGAAIALVLSMMVPPVIAFAETLILGGLVVQFVELLSGYIERKD